MQRKNSRNQKKFPTISVITPTLNREGLIKEAIESVLSQNYPNVQHIVVDGGSTDETLSVLARYSHLHVISEPDKGIADAMNKGVRQARGEIIGILNSDDIYADNIFTEVAQQFTKDPDVKTVSGGALVYEETKNGQKKIVLSFTDKKQVGLSYEAVMLSGGCINARFFHHDVYRDIGLFDTKYRIAGDREFLIRAAMAELKEVQIPQIICWYRRHPNSLTFGPDPSFEAQDEMFEILERYSTERSAPRIVHQQAKSSHSRRITRAVALSLRQGKFIKAFNYTIRGLRTNPKWLLILPWQSLQALKRRIQSIPQHLKHCEITKESRTRNITDFPSLLRRSLLLNRYRLIQELSSSPNRKTKFGERQESTIKRYKSYLKGKILSIGCGDGYELELLKEKGFEAEGIDVSKKILKQARKRRLKVTFGFQEKIPFPNKSFDTILSSHSLEHSYNKEEAAKEMQRVAKRAIIIVPIEPETDPRAVHASLFHSGKDLINLFKGRGTIIKSEPLQRLQQEYAIIIDFK